MHPPTKVFLLSLVSGVCGVHAQTTPAMRQGLNATAKMPVTVLAKARAVVPPDYHEMRRFTGRSTPAHRAAKKFLRGTNLGNYLEADFVHIQAEGFDHVRLPIAWHHYANAAPDFRLSDDIYAKADFLVTGA